MTNKEIFDFYVRAGMTAEGACAMMGNFMAESSMIPNNVQNDMTKLTDAQYTAAIDNGLLDFVDDIGYGYAQWTLASRKRNLLSFAKAKGTSIGDPLTQLEFSLKELKSDFRNLWNSLCTSRDMFQLTQAVCYDYENPAVKNVGTRYEFAQSFYNELVKGAKPAPTIDPVAATFPPNPSVMILQAVMQYNGYWGDITGYKSAEFFAKLREFVDDMEKC